MLRSTVMATVLFGLVACGQPGVVPYQAPATDARVLRDIRIVSTNVDVSAIGDVTRGREVAAFDVKQALEAAAIVDMRYIVGDRPAVVQLNILDVDLGSGTTFLGTGPSTMTGTATLLDAATGASLAAPIQVSALFNPGVNTQEGVIEGADFRGDDAVVIDLARQFVERARQQLVGS